MEWIAVLKLVLIITGSGLLFFSLRWLYLKLKEVNFRKGYDACQKSIRIKSLMLTMTLLTVLSLSACAMKTQSGATCPNLELQYGWSPTKEMVINDDIVMVKCMEVSDVEKYRIWSVMMQNTFCK